MTKLSINYSNSGIYLLFLQIWNIATESSLTYKTGINLIYLKESTPVQIQQPLVNENLIKRRHNSYSRTWKMLIFLP
jgi:hypothetical protein